MNDARETAERLRERTKSIPGHKEERRHLHLLGELALLEGETEEAIRKLDSAASTLSPRGIRGQTVPQHVPIWYSLGSAHLEAGNETEAAAYAESHNLPSKEPKDVVVHLANLPKENKQRKRVAIVTQGTEPTLVAIQGEEGIKEFPVHAIEKEKINDTNGAGDAFAGGFLAGLLEGKPLETSIDMGQWLARLSIQELGPS